MPAVVVHGPEKFGGIGIMDIYTKQGITHIKTIAEEAGTTTPDGEPTEYDNRRTYGRGRQTGEHLRNGIWSYTTRINILMGSRYHVICAPTWDSDYRESSTTEDVEAERHYVNG